MNKPTRHLDSPGPAARFLHESKAARVVRYALRLLFFPVTAFYKMSNTRTLFYSRAGDYLTDVMILGVLIPGLVFLILDMVRWQTQALTTYEVVGLGLGFYLVFGIVADYGYRSKFSATFL